MEAAFEERLRHAANIIRQFNGQVIQSENTLEDAPGPSGQASLVQGRLEYFINSLKWARAFMDAAGAQLQTEAQRVTDYRSFLLGSLNQLTYLSSIGEGVQQSASQQFFYNPTSLPGGIAASLEEGFNHFISAWDQLRTALEEGNPGYCLEAIRNGEKAESFLSRIAHLDYKIDLYSE